MVNIEFHVGDRVIAGAFGEGSVAKVDGMVPYQTLTVDFERSGRHVVNPVQVKLELLERGEEGLAADEQERREAGDRVQARAAIRTSGPVPNSSSPRPTSPASYDPPGSIAAELRRVLREELGIGGVEIGEKWAGGELVLRPGKPGLKEKSIPIEAFFAKIVMTRDRLRVLEQKINSNPKLLPADKIDLQGYITKIYGSLTTFNVMFAERDDWFVGEKGEE